MHSETRKRVLVTAAGSGIGLVIAKAFVRQGAAVAVCDISESNLAAAATAIPEASCSVTDVADPQQVDELFERVKRELGSLDVLVNNAGVAGPTAAVEDINPADWNRTLAVNINGQFYCTRRAVPLIKAAGGGSIVNISSVAGRFGYPLRTPYAASKWAVIGFTKSSAMELGPHGVRVNALLPGFVNNERTRAIFTAKAEATGVTTDELEGEILSRVSLRQYVTSEDIAEMAVFLCSDAGRHISGQAISVCGNVESMC